MFSVAAHNNLKMPLCFFFMPNDLSWKAIVEHDSTFLEEKLTKGGQLKSAYKYARVEEKHCTQVSLSSELLSFLHL